MATVSAKDVKALRDKTGAGMMDCKRSLADVDGDVEKAVELLRERGLAKAGKRAGRTTSEGSIGIAFGAGVAAIIELGCETDFVAKTDDFQSLVKAVADVVAADTAISCVEQALAAPLDDGTVEGRINAAVAKLGENIELKRVAGIEGGATGGYVHAGGKLGVIVGLRTSANGSEIEALAKDLSMHVAAVDPTPIAVDRDAIPGELITSERDILQRQALNEGRPEKVIERIIDGRMKKFFAEHCLLEQGFVKDPDQTVGEFVKKIAGSLGSEVDVTAFKRFKLGEATEA